jgi:hypothetical protein
MRSIYLSYVIGGCSISIFGLSRTVLPRARIYQERNLLIDCRLQLIQVKVHRSDRLWSLRVLRLVTLVGVLFGPRVCVVKSGL